MHLETGVLALGLIPLALAWWIIDRLVGRFFTPRVFVSYRRRDEEATYIPKRICGSLYDMYGIENVFFDTHSIEENDNYPPQIIARLDAADVVLAVIGPHWHGEGDGKEIPRILDPDDWVRREVKTGLEKPGKLVIVKAGNQQYPKESDIRFRDYSEPEWRRGNPSWAPEDRREEDEKFFKAVANMSSSIIFTGDDTVFKAALARLQPILKRRMSWQMRHARLAWRLCGPALVSLLVVGAIANEKSRRNTSAVYNLSSEIGTIKDAVAIKLTSDDLNASMRSQEEKRINSESALQKQINALQPIYISPVTLEAFLNQPDSIDGLKSLEGRIYIDWTANIVRYSEPMAGHNSFAIYVKPISGGTTEVRVLVVRKYLEKIRETMESARSSKTLRFVARFASVDSIVVNEGMIWFKK